MRSPPGRGSRQPLIPAMASSPQPTTRSTPAKKAWASPLTIPKGTGIVPSNASGGFSGGNASSPGRGRALPSTIEVVSAERKTKDKGLKALSLRDPAFKEVVGKYWRAMTDNGNLSTVNFSLYNLVHMRISKTLEPSFSEAEAREVAAEDFKSDTKGKPEMKRPLLAHSLYELACVWAKSQMEQSGLTCETQHLVYFLTQMFENIAEELIIEARRVVKLKEMKDIKHLSNFIAVNFRLMFNVDAAKRKLLAATATAAAKVEQEEIRAEKAEAARAEALRLRNITEARWRAEERATWQREKTRYQQELNEWTRLWQVAKARVGQAKYELGREEDLAREQRQELESLMRVQVQLALATGGQLIPGGQLLAVRNRWKEIGELLAGTERRIVERTQALEDAKAALAGVPPQPDLPIRRRRDWPPVKHHSAWAC